MRIDYLMVLLDTFIYTKLQKAFDCDMYLFLYLVKKFKKNDIYFPEPTSWTCH